MSSITKVVKIQELTPSDRKSYIKKQDLVSRWKREKCDHYSKDSCKCNVLCYMENVEANVHVHPNSFFGAFIEAYNNHEELVLSPDDVWLTICLQFSKYINDNADSMRELVVSHEGKKKLTVTTGTELSESQWDEFFTLMIGAIKNNTKDGIVDTLKADFTTTGRVERLMSVATVMNSFKEYFEYGRCIPLCGIRGVRFMGSADDWTKLIDKTAQLERYAVTSFWSEYIQKLLPILKQFLDTFNEKVDIDFWNRVMNLRYGALGSGSTAYVSGWILNFFGIYREVEASDIKNETIDVPVEIENRLTGLRKNVSIVGGFGGVNKTDGAYRPQMSMIVFHDGNEKPL